MPISFCPGCHVATGVQQQHCGWKYRCDACFTTWVILDITTIPSFGITLMDEKGDEVEYLDGDDEVPFSQAKGRAL